MRKYTFLLILILLFLAGGLSQAQSIALRVPDTTVVSGNNFDIPIYADSSLTGKNITSYTLQLTYNQSYIQPISVVITGTISASFGDPAVNITVPGKITIAGAGTTSLSNKGKFIYIRFKALQPGNINLSFTGLTYNYFNEGNPAMIFDNGDVNITTAPSITVSPDKGVIIKAEQLQFSVTGGTAPFQWFITNPAVATIDATGLLIGTQFGFTKVIALDNNGLRDTTEQIEVRSARLYIPTSLSQLQGTDINVPVNTTDLSGLNITSGNFTIAYNTSYLTPVGIVQTGTLLESYQAPEINMTESGKFSLVFAGSTPLSGSGILIYVKFHVSTQNSGISSIEFKNGLFNENLVPSFTNGQFTTINLPVLSISPNTGSLVAGESIQLTVNGGGLLPLTWSVNDTVLASVNQSGLMTAKKSGLISITVVDSAGASANSGNFQIYDTKITMPDTVSCPALTTFYYPILINSLPSGKSVFSLQATMKYDTTYLTFVDIDTSGTLSRGWTYAKSQSTGQLIFAASGTTAFNLAGTILKLKFSIRPNFITGSIAFVNLSNVILNEGTPLPLVDNNGKITGAYTVSAGTVSGTSSVCRGVQSIAYSVSELAGATAYVWTLPFGAMISTGNNTNSITVNYSDTAVSGNIFVYGTNSCGNGVPSPNFPVTVNTLPGASGNITGLATVCQGQSGLSYSVPLVTSASSYNWTTPTGSSGTGTTNSITVDYSTSALSGNIVVKGINSCGNGATSTLAVTVNSLPANAGTISGLASVCQGQSAVNYAVADITNATSYVWTLPTGASGTSTSNAITLNYSASAVSGNIVVMGNNSCGNGAASILPITVNSGVPGAAGTISGAATVCQGQNSVVYTVPAITNAVTYTWTFPSGASGSSVTNTITIAYGTSASSGNISVKGTNTCGEGATSTLAITVSTIPSNAGTITGSAVVCQGQNSVNYTVPAISNASTYIWTLPSGASGSSTTNTISINYSTSAAPGNIAVKGNNSCGDGAGSTLVISVNNKPATPVINQTGNALHSNVTTGNQWYNQSGLISGATNQDYTPPANGNYYVIVTQSGCNSDQSNTINVTNVGIQIATNNRIFNVYPNPVSDELIIESEGNTDDAGFALLNSLGQVVIKGKLSGKTIVQTAALNSGIYFLRIEYGKSIKIKKIVKE